MTSLYLGKIENAEQHRDIGRYPADVELAQGIGDVGYRAAESRTPGDNLCEQRVVAQARGIAGITIPVDAHMWSRWRGVAREFSGTRRGRTVRKQFFKIYARLNRISHQWRRRSQSKIGELGTKGDTNLKLYEIDLRYFLGDCVFHLEPRIGLHEPKLVPMNEELERSEAGIANMAGQLYSDFQDAIAQISIERRCRRDLDKLLMPTLYRAVSFP